MSKIIKITYLESVYSKSGLEKQDEIEHAIQSMKTSSEEDRRLDRILGNDVDKEEPVFQTSFTEDDFKYVEKEGSIVKDEVSYYFDTEGEDTTSLVTKLGSILKVKESVNYLDQSLHN